MGWTGTQATRYKQTGKRYVIDVKAECDALWDPNHDSQYVLVKSAMVGSVYYAAVEKKKEQINGLLKDIPHDRREVFGAVVLTHVDNKTGEFTYKEISESSGPCEAKCPISIIKLLTPTDAEYAIEWRRRCVDYANNKKASRQDCTSLANLPIGAKIRAKMPDREIILTKMAPSYQFKTPWWYDSETNRYVPKSRIKNYKFEGMNEDL